MKTSSCPNLNRETTSFPNFVTLYQDPNHHDDTTIHKRRKVYHSEDTEASETSPPFKDILSPFNKMNDNHYPVGGSFHGWDEMELPRRPPSPNGSDTNVSVGSNQYSGNEDLFGEDEEVDEKAEDFINKFKQQLKLQRLDSLLRYKDILVGDFFGKMCSECFDILVRFFRRTEVMVVSHFHNYAVLCYPLFH